MYGLYGIGVLVEHGWHTRGRVVPSGRFEIIFVSPRFPQKGQYEMSLLKFWIL